MVTDRMWTVWIDQLTKRQINTTTEFLQIPNPANSSFTIFTLLIILNKANPIENESFSGGAPGRAKPGQPIYSAPLSAHRRTRTMQSDSIFSAGSALLFYINSVHCCPFKIEGVKTNPQNSWLLFRVHFTPTSHFTAVQISVLWHGSSQVRCQRWNSDLLLISTEQASSIYQYDSFSRLPSGSKYVRCFILSLDQWSQGTNFSPLLTVVKLDSCFVM